MSQNDPLLAGQVALLDHRTVDWSQVQHTRYWMYQRFEYRYPGSIRELRQRLVVFPPDRYGDQRLCSSDLRVSAPGAVTTSSLDAFGNHVFLIYTPQVDASITFEMQLVVERQIEAAGWPHVDTETAALYLAPTRLTTADARIAELGQQFAQRYTSAEALAEAINSWVYQALRYRAGVTSVETTAAEALAHGAGLCQDYAHVMLAICRAAGLPARYISGHMLGEGGSHAWVEILRPDPQGGYRALAFDPTNHRRVTPAYITVAIGRDYSDVSPTSGSFIAPYAGSLTTSKRAGLTHVAYR